MQAALNFSAIGRAFLGTCSSALVARVGYHRQKPDRQFSQLLRPVRRVGVEEQRIAGLHRIELRAVAIGDLALQQVDELEPGMLEGEVVYRHADRLYTLTPGDSLFFDADAPHGPEELVKLPIRFLSVISYARDAE